MPRNLLTFMFGMKKCLIVLLCVTSPVIPAQAADPGDQLLGFWRPDMTRTLALAKKSNRELDPIMQNIMGKMVFEFQKDKMIVHGPPGFSSDNPPVPYSVKGGDQTADSLTLSANGKETKVRFHNGQMVLTQNYIVARAQNKVRAGAPLPLGESLGESVGASVSEGKLDGFNMDGIFASDPRALKLTQEMRNQIHADIVADQRTMPIFVEAEAGSPG